VTSERAVSLRACAERAQEATRALFQARCLARCFAHRAEAPACCAPHTLRVHCSETRMASLSALTCLAGDIARENNVASAFRAFVSRHILRLAPLARKHSRWQPLRAVAAPAARVRHGDATRAEARCACDSCSIALTRISRTITHFAIFHCYRRKVLPLASPPAPLYHCCR